MSRGAEVTVGTPEVVIATKLFAPSPRHQRVSRERLHGRLRAGLRVPLTLVVAPAGWGKTTVVAEWLRMTTSLPVGCRWTPATTT